DALDKIVDNPQRPLVVIVGGSKVSSKLSLLESLVNLADQLIVGGGIANTFIAAAGFPIGKSLYEPDLLAEANRLSHLAKQRGAGIPLPTDVIVANEFSATASATLKPIEQVADNEMILDIGPKTAQQFAQL